MNIYAVTAVVDGFDMDSEFQNAGIDCLDYVAVASRTGGVTRIDVEVEAPTPVDAMMRIMTDLRSINVTVIRFDPGLVTVPEIAERCNTSRETARLWATGKRRGDFPKPYAVVGSTPVWFWSEVWSWASQRGRSMEGQCAPVPSEIVEAMNGALAQVRYGRKDGWLKPTSAPVVSLTQRRATRNSRGWLDADVKLA